jgi:NADPH2:quinone reductase
MTTPTSTTHEIESGLQLRSLLTPSGELELTLESRPVNQPSANEVVVRVEAAPVNPSDLGLLLGAADVSTTKTIGEGASRRTTISVPDAGARAMSARVGKAMAVGNEGAGVVISTGEAAKALLGKTVAVLGGGMYGQYRTLPSENCLVLPEGVSPVDGASCFVNPLTALGMVETMRRENHTALVHTAAASNLGQMLNKVCQKDGVSLVNVVRSAAQADLLRGIGARYVCDSSADNFMKSLVEAISETGATLAFDAIGGGRIASKILTAMETTAQRKMAGYSGYGSSVYKQVYIYGGLDMGPTELTRSFGMTWGIGGWLLAPFLQRIGPARAAELRARVAAEVRTTFASHYTQTISLADLLQPEILKMISRKATGEKFLIAPTKT